MESSPGRWRVAGLVAGVAGLATSYLVAGLMSLRESPVVAVADLVVRLTPGPVAEAAIDLLGHADKPVLVGGILVVAGLLFAGTGALARRAWWLGVVGYAVLAGAAAVAVLSRNGAKTGDALPVVVGFVTWVVALAVLIKPLQEAAEASAAGPGSPQPGASYDASSGGAGEPFREPAESSRRTFLLAVGGVAAAAGVVGALGRVLGGSRRRVEESRRLLRLPEVTRPVVPPGVRTGVEGVAPWATPVEDFYLIDTAIAKPTIEPKDWALRIHGLVDREITLTYEQLVARQFTEAWITLSCVSNPVGGDLVGNAWWSGVRVADLLAEAGVHADADAVLQTSSDDWTCGTPLSALTDDRNAMLAVAMNGRPLEIDHGFPVRTVVPGLFGYVSACKWVVDWEVTRFSDITAFWTDKGWSEQGPVKLASRIDVPRSGADLEAGAVAVAGVAWSQHTGVAGVEVAVDDGPWQPATLAEAPNVDTWVQWQAEVDLEPGDHVVRVRATDRDGEVQTGVEVDVVPDGATGWHSVEVSVG